MKQIINGEKSISRYGIHGYALVLILLITFTQANAQKYQPLVEEEKYWIYQYLHQPEGGACIFYWTEKAEIHHFGKDTLLGNITYKEILYSSLKLIGEMGSVKVPFEIIQTKVMGYIREDTATKKIYVVPNDLFIWPCNEDYKENLLFDFSLVQGDSINECLAYYIYQLRDQFEYPRIDSIKLELDIQGKPRNHLYSFGYFEPCNLWHVPGYIMEGFGFIDGPFRGPQNRQLINYCEGTLAECNIIISNTKDTPFNDYKISITPNPTTDFIKIETGLDIKGIEIMDQNGMSVLRGNDKEIDASHLISGVYFVKCISIKSEIYYGKFIKL
jgi:Secretion system C-terminal sorting domain